MKEDRTHNGKEWKKDRAGILLFGIYVACLLFSFVLVDDEKETVAELLLIDDEDTLLLSDELLKGLDEELDDFLKKLLEEK